MPDIFITDDSPLPQGKVITEEAQIVKFPDYMLDTRINKSNTKFDRQIGNQFENEGPRTTNNAEGFNHKLNSQAQSRRSFKSLYTFFKKIQFDIDAQKFD